MKLYLYNFNVYYNRIIKTYDSINRYPTPLIVINDINFNPNDGIETEQIINYNGEIPNYAIVTDDEGYMLHRWFVIEAKRTRAQQFRMQLRRDLIADYFESISNAPIFIEKATASLGDPAIFNNENMGFNQIKYRENTIKDETAVPWIVGYIARNTPGQSITVSRTARVSAEYNSIEEYEFSNYTSAAPYLVSNKEDVVLSINIKTDGEFGATCAFNRDNIPTVPLAEAGNSFGVTGLYLQQPRGSNIGVPATSNRYDVIINRLNAEMLNLGYYDPTAYFESNINVSAENILKENGRLIKIGDKYYNVRVDNYPTSNITISNVGNNSALGMSVLNLMNNTGYFNVSQATYKSISIQAPCRAYIVNLVETSNVLNSYTIDIPGEDARVHLNDAPYDMFCIPVLGSVHAYIDTVTGDSKIYPGMEYELAYAISKELQSGSYLYDLQLLPYSPLPTGAITSFTSSDTIGERYFIIDSNELEADSINTLADSSQSKSAVMVWCSESNFSKFIYENIPAPSDAISFKISNECDIYRLVSPNYNGGFEFTLTKLGGLNGFNVNCSYKPFSPYIRIAPVFGGLYGPIQDDARGLICGGNFSLPIVNDAWQQFEINNKNYANIFDRQIENIEFNNNMSRIQEAANVIVGASSAAMIGGKLGPLAGGIGAGLSFAAGAVDIALNEARRNEALDYTRDNFGYNLGNIKALPQSLSKVSAFNPNNKIFPILEYYTCTDTEKEALRNKLKYNGMTIMRIGTISEFIKADRSYIKGRLIKLELSDDSHIVTEIANELYKGVYI